MWNSAPNYYNCEVPSKSETGQSPSQPVITLTYVQLYKRGNDFSEMPEVTQPWVFKPLQERPGYFKEY